MSIDLGARIAAKLPELQAAAESMMVDSCVITRLDPEAPWVPGPGDYEVPPPGIEVYAGRCKVQTYEAFESKRDVGGSTVVIQRYAIHVPVGAGPFEVGDVVTVAARVYGERKFRVAGLHEKSLQTAQRLLVDEGASDDEPAV